MVVNHESWGAYWTGVRSYSVNRCNRQITVCINDVDWLYVRRESRSRILSTTPRPTFVHDFTHSIKTILVPTVTHIADRVETVSWTYISSHINVSQRQSKLKAPLILGQTDVSYSDSPNLCHPRRQTKRWQTQYSSGHLRTTCQKLPSCLVGAGSICCLRFYLILRLND